MVVGQIARIAVGHVGGLADGRGNDGYCVLERVFIQRQSALVKNTEEIEPRESIGTFRTLP